MTINIPLSTALAESHKFWYIVFLFSFISVVSFQKIFIYLFMWSFQVLVVAGGLLSCGSPAP